MSSAMILQPFGRYEEGWWSEVRGDRTVVTSGPGAYRPFRMFVPDLIADLRVAPPLELAQRLAEVEAALARLDGLAEARALRALTPLLAHQESMASSWIEGLEIGYRRLAQAVIHPDGTDATAHSVLGNVEATRLALAVGREPDLTVDHILKLHRVLMADAPRPWSDIAGALRSGVIWIGPPGTAPPTAEYVGPPARQVPRLLQDLVAFMRRTDIPTLMQAAIAHAQFETIHPFADGNGRVGRCLVHALFSRHGVGEVVIPISSALAADRQAYIAGLAAYQQGELGQWVQLFVNASQLAAQAVSELERDLTQLRTRWRDRLRRRGARGDAADWPLLDLLLEQPVLDIATVIKTLDVSHPTAATALARLEELGIVLPGERRWRREWTASEVIELMAATEWRFRARSQDPEAAAGLPTG